MDSRECCKLWENDGDHKPLRRPNATANAVEKPGDPGDPKASDGDLAQRVSTTKLSVDAKEWFPKGYAQQPQQQHQQQLQQQPVAEPVGVVGTFSSAQDRLKKIRLSDASPGRPDPAFNPSKMQSILQSLTYDPGQFDHSAETLMDLLEPYFPDMDVSHAAADMIFQFALVEPSFRYNGARLCCIVDEHCPMFRSRLHLLCEKELQGRNNPQGLTLFLAELYMQLNYESIYGRSLMLSIENLLKLGKEDDIKCVCQTLKLTGYSLEESHSDTLDEIFLKLEELKPTFSQSLLNILESTVKLRRNHWGRNTGSASTNSNQEQNGYITSGDGDYILYGPDGQEITSEEQEFLCANFDDYLADESSDPDELFDPEPEMDPEIQEAFREFVKMGKR